MLPVGALLWTRHSTAQLPRPGASLVVAEATPAVRVIRITAATAAYRGGVLLGLPAATRGQQPSSAEWARTLHGQGWTPQVAPGTRLEVRAGHALPGPWHQALTRR